MHQGTNLGKYQEFFLLLFSSGKQQKGGALNKIALIDSRKLVPESLYGNPIFLGRSLFSCQVNVAL
ncbi:hypothetical protein A6J40_18145 [Legionella longbeachae]|uniref:Uncharacterized protein n=1 Tax=Legionella longbeachae serogroup 1 (strain NSW150) TaxID=661367 RepID=D3HJI5_LEGLN|nr:hypothetical protein A6J40_18145 [Legionella longbeachae]CBJ12578.1 hypothetical protein LLO_2177 [Legionella longbeachae NSW150]